jgi:hypothetical protein
MQERSLEIHQAVSKIKVICKKAKISKMFSGSDLLFLYSNDRQ